MTNMFQVCSNFHRARAFIVNNHPGEIETNLDISWGLKVLSCPRHSWNIAQNLPLRTKKAIQNTSTRWLKKISTLSIFLILNLEEVKKWFEICFEMQGAWFYHTIQACERSKEKIDDNDDRTPREHVSRKGRAGRVLVGCTGVPRS